MNLHDEFKVLKQKIDTVLDRKSIEEQQKKDNLNKLKSDMCQSIRMIDDSLRSKKSLYQDSLNFTYDVDTDYRNINKTCWCFTLKDYNYSVKVKLEANEKNDIRLNLYQIPRPNFIFYILNQDGNWKFAKLAYRDTRFEVYSRYTNIDNAGYDLSFNEINKSNIVWLSDLSKLTDCILSEVIRDIKINVK